MAKKFVPEGRRFEAGISGNPAGRPKEPEILKTLRRLTKAEIADMGTLLLEKPISELEAMAKDKANTTGLKAAILGMLNAATKGNPAAFDKLLDRIVGKQKDRIELSGQMAVRQRYDAQSDEEIKAKATAAAMQTSMLLEEAPLPGAKKSDVFNVNGGANPNPVKDLKEVMAKVKAAASKPPAPPKKP